LICAPKSELDPFVEAMLAIRAEIQAVIDGTSDGADNALTHVPHTAQGVSANQWSHPYSREVAAFPVASLRHTKFWPAVSRIDNPYGDRNLFCSCPPIDASDLS
jgi:glycine dehydrogenase